MCLPIWSIVQNCIWRPVSCHTYSDLDGVHTCIAITCIDFTIDLIHGRAKARLQISTTALVFEAHVTSKTLVIRSLLLLLRDGNGCL